MHVLVIGSGYVGLVAAVAKGFVLRVPAPAQEIRFSSLGGVLGSLPPAFAVAFFIAYNHGVFQRNVSLHFIGAAGKNFDFLFQ